MSSHREIEQFLAIGSAYLLSAFNNSAQATMQLAEQQRHKREERRKKAEKSGVTQDLF